VRRGLFSWAVLIALAWVAAPSWADIRNTPHNLTRSSRSADESEVCIFCHTPGLSSVIPKSETHSATAPAWQKAVNLSLEFTIYDDIGRLGRDLLAVGSQSVACLSCHDGTQAPAVFRAQADHPYGMPYRGAIKNSRPASGKPPYAAAGSGMPFNAAKHLVGLDDFRDVSQGMIDGRPVYWVSRNGITQRRTRSDLPVYVRQSAGFESSVPYIECSSCHDPHSENELFLRASNSASQLCLTCHIK
jgi:predicted CXXCH cytochrome family protein